jgi:O-antigen/teichoic acid export membrane protein
MTDQIEPATEPPSGRRPHHMLDRSLLLGIAWTGGMRWATQIVRWAVTFAIARVLTPADYGVVGMAMVFHQFVITVLDLGLQDAIIRQRDLTDDDIARLSGLTLLYGVAFAALTVALAGPIGSLYGEPSVPWILIVLAPVTILEALQVPSRAILTRELRFAAIARIDAVAGVSLPLATLVFALAGAGYRSLVYATLTSTFLTAVAAIATCPRRFRLPRRASRLHAATILGLHVALHRVGVYAYTNADFAVISFTLGKVALGAYTFAWSIATIPVDRVGALVAEVVPGVFAAVQHDLAALRRYWIGTTEGLAFLILPLAGGLAVAADDVVLVALGDRWRDTITPLRFLAVYGAIRSLAMMVPPVLIATGHARRNLDRTILAVVLLPPLFFIGSRWGLTGVSAAWIIGFPLASLPAYLFTFRLLQMTPADYLRAIWPALSATILMVIVVALVRLVTAEWPLVARFALEVTVGAATYAGVVFVRHKARVEAFLAVLRSARHGDAAPGSFTAI